MPKPVLSKQDFVERYIAGEFGNRSPTWETPVRFLKEFPLRHETWNRLFHLRNRVAGGPTYYNVPNHHMGEMLEQLEDKDVDLTQFYVSEMAPTKSTILQGEVVRDVGGLQLTWSTLAKPMRNALYEESRFSHGLTANLILQTYLDPTSYDWIQELFDLYPDHVVEFSTYDHCWGAVPSRNTVIWEVRLY